MLNDAEELRDPPKSRLFRVSSMGQSLAFYLSTAFVYRVVGLARGVILAWIMTEYEFGILQIILLAINILTPLCGLGLNEALARYVPQYESRHQLRSFLGRVVPHSLAVAAILCGLVFLAAGPISHFLFSTFAHVVGATEVCHSRMALMRLATVTTFVMVGYVIALAIVRGARMFVAVSLMEFASNVSFTIVAILAALKGNRSAEVIVITYGGTYLATLILFGLPLWRVIHRIQEQRMPSTDGSAGSIGLALSTRLLSFSVWVALSAILWQVVQYYPTWYLQKVYGPEVVAVFGGVRSITQAVLIVATSIVMVVQAEVIKTWETTGHEAADRRLVLAGKGTSLMIFLVCVILTIGSPLVIRLFPGSYAGGMIIIPLSLIFFMICSHLVFMLVHFTLIEKTRYIFALWLVGVLGNIVFAGRLITPGLTEMEALTAAAWSGVLAVSISLLVGLIIMRIEKRPLDAGSMLLLAFTFVLLMPIYVLFVMTAGLLLLAALTDVILSADEKQWLWQFLIAQIRRRRHSPDGSAGQVEQESNGRE